jgi:hypothetical protein
VLFKRKPVQYTTSPKIDNDETEVSTLYREIEAHKLNVGLGMGYQANRRILLGLRSVSFSVRFHLILSCSRLLTGLVVWTFINRLARNNIEPVNRTCSHAIAPIHLPDFRPLRLIIFPSIEERSKDSWRTAVNGTC